MILQELEEKKLLKKAPYWLSNNTHYLTISGSISYGCADTNADKASDFDTIGICIPPRENTFPHLAGYLHGFDEPPKLLPHTGEDGKGKGGVYEEHHVLDPDALGGKGRNYDFNIYNIVKFVSECSKGNPNLIDSLFTSRECVLHCTQVGNLLRENRKLFLAKNLWSTYKGYAYSQLHKMDEKNPVGKRVELREKFGFDVKFAYNVVRIIDEAEQIFTTGDLDLMRNREQLKSIRRGEWTVEEIRDYLDRKERLLEEIYLKSDLPMKPDHGKLKEVLIQCLEYHYGNVSECVVNPDRADNLLKEIKQMIYKAGY